MNGDFTYDVLGAPTDAKRVLKLYLNQELHTYCSYTQHHCKTVFSHRLITESFTTKKRTNKFICVRIQAVMVPIAKMISLRNTAPCSLVEVVRRFRGAYCLHHLSDDGGSTHV